MSTVQIDQLADEIARGLENYIDDMTENIKKAVDTVAKETNEEIKKHITFKKFTGKYVKAFRIKTSYEDRYNKRNTWYVGNGQYRLTHLLEKGHALVQGGRSRAYPHIKYGEELAKQRMEELAKEAIEDAGH
jgi:hypothetical protein